MHTNHVKARMKHCNFLSFAKRQFCFSCRARIVETKFYDSFLIPVNNLHFMSRKIFLDCLHSWNSYLNNEKV